MCVAGGGGDEHSAMLCIARKSATFPMHFAIGIVGKTEDEGEGEGR